MPVAVLLLSSAVCWVAPMALHPRTAARLRMSEADVKPVHFSILDMTVAGLTVPVAVWAPCSLQESGGGSESAEAYRYTVDIGRIATKLEVNWLSWLPSRTYDLPPPDVPAGSGTAAGAGEALIFAHGFLGSPFDLAHACVALASDGFVVAAPELPESLAASYEAREGLTREAIVQATRAAIDERFESTGRRWGIFGHSAGSGTALTQPGEFALGRACLATSLGRGLACRVTDPIFLVASEGDGCNAFMQEKGASTLRDALTLATLNTPPFTTFGSAEDAYASLAEAPRSLPARGVLLFREGDALVPNHISFLWGVSNQALFDLLAGFLPLAKALNLFLLDFDNEMEQKLAEPTAELVVPALRRFFGGFAAAQVRTEDGGGPGSGLT